MTEVCAGNFQDYSRDRGDGRVASHRVVPGHPVDSPAEAALQVLGAIGDAPSPQRQLPDAILGRLQQIVGLVVVHFKVPLVGAQPQRHLLQPHGGSVEAMARSLVSRVPLFPLVRSCDRPARRLSSPTRRRRETRDAVD